jgi:hypothetical protein
MLLSFVYSVTRYINLATNHNQSSGSFPIDCSPAVLLLRMEQEKVGIFFGDGWK